MDKQHATRLYLNATSPADTTTNYSRYLTYTTTPPRQLTDIDRIAIDDLLTDTRDGILYLAALLPDLGYTTRNWWDYATHTTNDHAAHLAWCLGALTSHAHGIDADVANTQAQPHLKALNTDHPDNLHTTNLTSLFTTANASGEPDFTTVHTLLSHALYTIYGTHLTDSGILTPDDLAHRIITTTATDLDGELAALTDGTFISQPTDTADDSTLDTPRVTASPSAPMFTVTDEAHLTPSVVHTHRMLHTEAREIINDLNAISDPHAQTPLTRALTDKLTDIITVEPILLALMANGELRHHHLELMYNLQPESSPYRDFLACAAFVHATSNHHHLHYGPNTFKDDLSDNDYAILEQEIHANLDDAASMLLDRAARLDNPGLRPMFEPGTIIANWPGHLGVLSEIITAITEDVETRTGDAESSMMTFARLMHPYNNSPLSTVMLLVSSSLVLHAAGSDSLTQAAQKIVEHQCLNTDSYNFICALVTDLISASGDDSARAYHVLSSIDSVEPGRIFVEDPFATANDDDDDDEDDDGLGGGFV